MFSSVPLYEPRALDEAVAVLGEHGEDAKIVAGGTAMQILLRQRLIDPAALVSLKHVPGLGTVSVGDRAVTIGALVTHRDVEISPVVRREIPVLAQVFGAVANVRVRCAATVGGVLAEADYASDPPAVLLALDAEVVAHGPCGERTIPLGDFLVGFYETALEPDEIVVALRIPIPVAGTTAVYDKYRTRSSEDRPCVGVVAAVRTAADGRTCEDLRLAIGAASETPLRLPDVEAGARGRDLTDELAAEIAEAYAGVADTLDDMRGSAWYRTEMIRVLSRRAILRAHRGG